MTTKKEVIRAMNILTNPAFYRDSATPIELQIVESLRVYESRGEYDSSPETGMSYKQAKECLELAGYEIHDN